MSEKFIPVKMDLQQFLAGQAPQMPDYPRYIDTIADLQKACVLRGDAQFQVQCALICTHEEIGGRNFDSVTGAMMHVFNTRDHSSRLFTIDAKDGQIDWNALRDTIQRHTQAPHAVSTYWENANGVSETDIHRPSTFTQRIAESLVSQMTNYTIQERRDFLADAEKRYAASTATTEKDRMFEAIRGALSNLPEREGKLSEIAAYQAATITLDPAKRAEIMLNGVSDAHSCMMREQWTGNYAHMQQQGLTPQQAGALSMIRTLSIHMEYHDKFNGPTDTAVMTKDDYAECLFARAEAVDMARAAGCSEYEIGRARNPALITEVEFFGHTSPTDTYLNYAKNIYAMAFSDANKPIAATMFDEVLQAAPGNTPNEQVKYAIEHAREAIQSATGEQPPTFEMFEDTVRGIRPKMADQSICIGMHSGDLTPDVANQLQEIFTKKLFEVGASRDMNQYASLAIALNKAVQELRHSPELKESPGMRYSLAGISAETISELADCGMTADQMHDALDEHDEVGDDAI